MNIHLYSIIETPEEDISLSIPLNKLKTTLDFIISGFIASVSAGCDYFDASQVAYQKITGISLLINTYPADHIIKFAEYRLDLILREFEQAYIANEKLNETMTRSIALKVYNELNQNDKQVQNESDNRHQ
jgi:hypothetical protein